MTTEQADRSIEVRTVDPTEWQTWREIRLRALGDSPDAFGSTLEQEEALAEADWTSRLDGPAVLAWSGEESVGMGAGWLYEPGAMMVVAMWTDPRHRGRGVGSLVLEALVGWALERGLRPDLWVEETNLGARRVYERHGFVADGTIAPLRDGSDLTRLHLVLP